MLAGLSHYSLLPKAVWKRLPVQQTFAVRLAGGTTFLYESTCNDGIGRALFWKGIVAWEPETVSVFLALAREARIVLDIGANTGLYTLLACTTCSHSRIIAFEPVPRIHRRLVRQIELNSWQHRCTLLQAAASNLDGEARFHVPWGDLPKSASLCLEGFRNIAGEMIKVPVRRADSVVPDQGCVDLVKIDVEGFEPEVLEGMEGIMVNSRPQIVLEVNADAHCQRIESLLGQYGYTFFHLSKQGPVPTRHLVPDRSERCRNYLCVVN